MSATTETYTFESWIVTATSSHILPSKCDNVKSLPCTEEAPCHYCRYINSLNIPHLPEMVYHLNTLKITRESGSGNRTSGIEFNALDALKLVLVGEMPLKVSCSDDWKACRLGTGLTENHINPFDWTFTTDYAGSLFGNVTATPTPVRIDIEKLKQREEILFYKELILFEDELHDNGIAVSTVKIRIMASGFFILLRYFLRVDNVLIRVNDTRLYYGSGTGDYMIRERSSREAPFKQNYPFLSSSDDPSDYIHLLPLKYNVCEKLTFQ